MINTTFTLQRYDADEGKVFDYKVPRFNEVTNEDGTTELVEEHLYAKTLFLSATDSIENYIEVEQ